MNYYKPSGFKKQVYQNSRTKKEFSQVRGRQPEEKALSQKQSLNSGKSNSLSSRNESKQSADHFVLTG